jgi:hypothetical protein
MNCQSYEEVLAELARDRTPDRTPDQTMEADLRERAMVHLDKCTACARRLQDGRALTHRLDEMAREMRPLTASARVEEELRNTFRLTFSRPVSSPARAIDRQESEVRVQRSEIRGRWNRLALGAAAVLLIVLGIVGLHLRAGRQSQPESGRTEVAGAQTSPRPPLSIVEAGISGLPSKSNMEATVAARRTNPYRRPTHSFNRIRKTIQQVTAETTAATADDLESEVATQFMPLSYAGPINPQDGGQLVRVELSRVAMLSMGLPVNMDRYSERVKADVLLGADGLARAIRFVQ